MKFKVGNVVLIEAKGRQSKFNGLLYVIDELLDINGYFDTFDKKNNKISTICRVVSGTKCSNIFEPKKKRKLTYFENNEKYFKISDLILIQRT